MTKQCWWKHQASLPYPESCLTEVFSPVVTKSPCMNSGFPIITCPLLAAKQDCVGILAECWCVIPRALWPSIICLCWWEGHCSESHWAAPGLCTLHLCNTCKQDCGSVTVSVCVSQCQTHDQVCALFTGVLTGTFIPSLLLQRSLKI